MSSSQTLTETQALTNRLSTIRYSIHKMKNELTQIQLLKQRMSLKNEIKTLNHQMTELQYKINQLNVRKTVKKERKQVKSVKYHNQIPDAILGNKVLQQAIADRLPNNYNFEINKIIWRLSQCAPKCKRVGLQLPEGLLMYACIIADILEEFANVECIILGDVAYGACCIDDYTSDALQCDFLIHFGHSCLVPITTINERYYKRILYIFVQININETHLIETIKLNFAETKNKCNIVMAGTIQFVHVLQSIKNELCTHHGYNADKIMIPQAKPLSPAEVLGCTSPQLNHLSNDTIVLFISDGRFHLESLMISNPQMTYFRYNPYDNKITQEVYDTDLMHKIRQNAIQIAQTKYDKQWCIILSTLGRQGNVNILDRLCRLMKEKHIKYVICLLSEIYGDKLRKFDLNEMQCFIQVGCPRLSIDWGQDAISNNIPLLNPYEATVALQHIKWKQIYPMDFYSNDGGIWTNYYRTEKEKQQRKLQRIERRKRLRKKKLQIQYQ